MSWDTFIGTFSLVFLAELGDKTQLAVLSQTCKYRTGLSVFFGSSAALIATTALGAVFGHLLGTFIPPMVIRIVAAMAFIIMGFLIWREACQSEEEPQGQNCDVESLSHGLWNWRAFASTFALLFVAELGDKTQLAILGLASRQEAPWTVFLGGALALVTLTGLAVLGGEQLCRLIPRKTLLRAAAILFVVLGGLMALGIL